MKFLFLGIITLIIIAIGWNLGLKELLGNIETISLDWRSKIAVDDGGFNSGFAKASKDIILVEADNYCFKKLKEHPELGIGRWPWPRRTLGEVADFINRGKPKAIVFDINFEGQEGFYSRNIESDKYFARSLRENKNAIIGLALFYPRLAVKNEIESVLKQKTLRNAELDELIYNILDSNNKPIRQDLTLKIDDSSLSSLNTANIAVKDLFNNITFYGYGSVVGSFLENTDKIGIINLKTNAISTYRHHIPVYRLVTDHNISYIPSLSLAAAMLAMPDKDRQPVKLEKNKIIIGKRIIPVDNEGKFLINWHGPGGTYNNISIAKILLTDAYNRGKIKTISKFDKISPEEFKDKIVVIGQTSAGSDIHPTPMEMNYPGPEIIATSIDNILNDTDTINSKARKFVTEAPFWLNVLILLIFCAAVGIFNIRTKHNFLGIIWFLLLITLFIITAVVVFVHPQTRLWINMTYPTIFMALTAIGTYIYRIYSEEIQKKEIEQLFGKFVSSNILNKLLADPKSINREGQRKIMTVLFSDLRGFTAISEHTDPQKLIIQLNEYFTEMVEIILKHNGTMDKYIGDSVMAFFGDPLPMEDHALMAVLTAIDMKNTLNKLNEKWQAEGRVILDIGIGINTGEMVVGHIGSPRFLDYTVIGDNVNLASRLESLNKEYKTNIIISESTYLAVKDFIDTLYIDECKVKGKQNAVKIFEVIGLKSEIA